MICLQPFSFSYIEITYPLTLGDSRLNIIESLRSERQYKII